MLSNTQSYSKIPLILTCDEEGGRVNRLMSTVGTTYIGPMFGYRDQGAETARQNAHTIASDMRVLGFNADLAPVADVWSNPDNTVIGDRAYSDDFAQAAELIPEAVRGFHSGGVATTLKHFPGHGDALADSHDGAVYVSKPLEQLRREELLPFRAGIASGSDMVMIGHLILTEIDAAQPAPFSYRIVTELLREELGFQGVVITDGLQMKALTDSYTSGGNRPPCGVGRSRYPALPRQTRRRPSPLWRKRSRWEKSAKSGSTKVCADPCHEGEPRGFETGGLRKPCCPHTSFRRKENERTNRFDSIYQKSEASAGGCCRSAGDGVAACRLLRRDGAFGAVFRYRQLHSVRQQHACRFGAGAGT